ncbi:MAG: thiamine-phosphate kinase [Actinomycetota bacterium]
MSSGDQPVSSIGESGLLARFATKLPSAPEGQTWSGDDAAVIEVAGATCLLTTDAIVEFVDFDLAYASGADVGWKAVAINVSDIAAMGGRPASAVATLALRPDHSVELVDDVLAGLLDASENYDIAIVGGDVTEAAELALSVTMLGEVGEAEPVLRSGAKPGDALCVTGRLGGARTGHLVLSGKMDADRADPAIRGCIERQLRPIPRAKEGLVLGRFATAMIDLSDGLAIDLRRLLDASGVGCEVDPAAIPVDPGITGAGLDPLDTAIVGGEDFELLCSIPAASVDAATAGVAECGTTLSRVGTITSQGATIGSRSLDEWIGESWDHLRPR